MTWLTLAVRVVLSAMLATFALALLWAAYCLLVRDPIAERRARRTAQRRAAMNRHPTTVGRQLQELRVVDEAERIVENAR